MSIRLPTLERNFWSLASDEKANAENPDTFWIPERERREQLRRGDAAKMIFEIESEDADTGAIVVNRERMWVIVTEKIGDTYIGMLDNQPATIEPADDVYLRFGAEVPFKAEHIIDIDRPPDDYIERQLGQPPARRWPRK